MPQDLDLDRMLGWLEDHTNAETGGKLRSPSLERMAPLVELLGSPQRDYPIVHVTGTNGKTTTARMAARLLGAAGLAVGCYTSPHLERVHERISWAGEPISGAALAEVLDLVAAAEPALSEHPSYFEVVTAAAYRWFADLAVDAAVVEVGMGGTWDATNVADGTVAVVTNVSIDHTEYLGPTRASIAAEKAGIVKEGATLVLGETDPELAAVFTERGPSRVLRRGDDFDTGRNRRAHGGRVVDLHTPWSDHPEVFLPLHGEFQADNVVTALVAAEAFFDHALGPDVVAETAAGFRSPGRMEVVGRAPLILLDGAHNAAGAQALMATLEDEFAPGPRTLVVGLLREKDPEVMLSALEAVRAEQVVLCRPDSPRALDPADLAAAAERLGIPGDRLEVAGRV
ncbi:MAG: bifunctional folylpolyglutamate synthase/dihydrofolate synthase, partial [Acidimicrobiia bacterium]